MEQRSQFNVVEYEVDLLSDNLTANHLQKVNGAGTNPQVQKNTNGVKRISLHLLHAFLVASYCQT